MPEPPILIGRSFGGLIVQQLLDRGLGSAGIAVDSVAPEGVLALGWTVLKSNSSVLYALANTLPEEEQHKYYDRYVVPETGRIFFQIAFSQLDPHRATAFNFKNSDRAPLLLLAGEKDHLVPAHITKANY